jgi:hypothetical protein
LSNRLDPTDAVASWDVTIKKGQHLGVVEAPDERAAVAKAVQWW